jgi:hypothetical protein
MIRPVTHSLVIIRRSTFRFGVQLVAPPNNTPVDLSLNTVIAQMWNRARTEKYKDFTIDVTEASTGQIELSLTSDQTIGLPRVGVYDIKVIYPTGDEYFLVAGGFTVQDGYTDD